MVRTTASKIKLLLGSKWFYRFILVFFVFESAWIAFSAVYPQAFDENFHFGLIKVYSHYWLPFLTHQPPGANAFGAVARDPSYLYQYLMSFPYRLFAHFVHAQAAQVIFIRLIDIGLFSVGLALFHRMLRRIGISKQLSSSMLFLFVLIPVVPLLAAQINYDDLLFPFVAGACLLTFRLIDEIKQKRPSAQTILTLASVCMLASLVKVVFLPIFAAIVLFVAFLAYKNFKGSLSILWLQLRDSFVRLSSIHKIALVALVLISLGLFMQRDGLNVLQYHSVSPACNVVLSIKECSTYSVWLYDYSSHLLLQANPGLKTSGTIAWLGEWLYWMWYRLFFAINGPASSNANYPPLPLPAAAAILIGIVSSVAIIKLRKRLFRGNPYLAFLALASALYIIVLMLTGYITYQRTAVLEFMNGRYLLPILLLLAALAGRAISLMLRKRENYKVLAVVIALVLFLQGGGFLTFIARSDQSWYWPNQTVTKINKVAGSITKYVVVKGRTSYGTPFWFFN